MHIACRVTLYFIFIAPFVFRPEIILIFGYARNDDIISRNTPIDFKNLMMSYYQFVELNYSSL